MISAGHDDYHDAQPSLQWWSSFNVLSGDVEIFDNDENDVLHHQYNMTGRYNTISTAKFTFIFFVILGFILSFCNAKISDKRLCYDKDCLVPISKGKTTLPYNSKDHDVLSFPVSSEVLIYSKSAGNRQDLWGVEINGKRGYAPKSFIRETKILKSKLEYIVPTEEIFSKEEKNVAEVKKSSGNDRENVSTIIQEDHRQNETIDTINENIEKTITPHQISPSYDTIYDGTVIPRQNEDTEAPPPSYSTQTLQDIKDDDEVRLNMYPNILSSTFSAGSGIISNTEKNIEENNIQIDSSEKVTNEETENMTEKPVEMEKSDKSSLNSQETQDEKPAIVSQNNIEGIVLEEFLQSQENETIDNNEFSLLSISDKDISSSGINKQEETENIDQSTVPESIEANEKKENDFENIDVINDSIQSANNEEQSLPPKNISTNTSFKNHAEEGVETISDNFENNFVPKEEHETVIDNLSSIDNDLSHAIVEETLDAVNFSNAENSITLEVPLKQDVEVAISSESFLSHKDSFQSNLSKNENIEIQENIEISEKSTKSDVVDEKSNLVNDFLNFKKQDDVNDNVVDSNNNIMSDNTVSTSIPTYLHNDSVIESTESSFQSTDSSHEHIVDIPSTSSFGEFLGNRNLLNAGKDSEEIEVNKVLIDEHLQSTTSPILEENISGEIKKEEENNSFEEVSSMSNVEKIVLPQNTCEKNYQCSSDHSGHKYFADENAVTSTRKIAESSETLLYVCITAVTTLLFSLGYYFIENKRRDAYLIAKINNLEKDLMITRKECIMLDENFKSTKTKLDSIEDESFGSNEMVLSLKNELLASENARAELEDQNASLEKELESTSEAGLELERMLRELLSSQSEENNPLAQSIEDLQVRLNEQQIANESLKNSLAIKTQENETLAGDLTVSLKKIDQLQNEVSKLSKELKIETSTKIQLEQTLTDQVQRLEIQIKSVTEDKSLLHKQLKVKELEIKELMEVVEQINSNNLDFEKLYEVSQVKAEAARLAEERDELKIKLSEEEGAHQLLEEHVKLVKEEVASLSDQCKAAEKEKKDAETKLEVLTKFFEEKETQRQKEEAIWLEKQGEVSSTVERIQTMQNEILNYKQQIEMLKHEILDQEREYKNQIAALETKAHEQWVAARQNERRLEEIKAESSQLRNRLTLVEKNINDADPEVKLHRLQGANGETGVGHPLFSGAAETSSSPLMFAGSGAVPPPLPPPSYMYGPGSFPPPPPFLPLPLPGTAGNPADLVGSRPPPLGGGRLSSPPPVAGAAATGGNSSSGNRYGETTAGGNPGAASPPMSPPPLPFPPPHHHPGLRSPPPPLPPFASDVPPPSLHHMPPLPPPLHHHRGDAWGDETLPPLRNSSGFHAHQRDHRARNHKGSLHSSGESLDKSHHGKV